MRILNVTAQKPDSTGSGVYLSELLKGFARMGHPQALLAGVYEEDRIDVPEDVLVYPVYFHTEELPFSIAGMSDEMPYKNTRYRDMTPEMTARFREAYKKRILQALEEFQPELIICHHLYYVTSLVKELAGNIPIYAVCHGTDLRQIEKNPWQEDYIKKQIPLLTGLFALHDEQKDDICRIFSCSRELVTVIGTGYNCHRFFIDEEIQKRKDSNIIKLIYAGKISEKKGVMSLLRALQDVTIANKKIQLVLAGGYGNEAEYLKIKELASASKYPAAFAGKLSQEELAMKMNESDIFILPSFFEGLPLVLVEAMACGLRVICTDLPGIRSWLDKKVLNHNVELVEPPQMERVDEPLAESLPDFEKRLTKAIQEVCLQLEKTETRPDLSKVSWDGLCEMILQEIK